jgi:hypothetical protein
MISPTQMSNAASVDQLGDIEENQSPLDQKHEEHRGTEEWHPDSERSRTNGSGQEDIGQDEEQQLDENEKQDDLEECRLDVEKKDEQQLDKDTPVGVEECQPVPGEKEEKLDQENHDLPSGQEQEQLDQEKQDGIEECQPVSDQDDAGQVDQDKQIEEWQPVSDRGEEQPDQGPRRKCSF